MKKTCILVALLAGCVSGQGLIEKFRARGAPVLGEATATLPMVGGKMRILQFADMHFEQGPTTDCADLDAAQSKFPCSDLNTTAFLEALLESEKPDLVVFTGDNIDGGSTNATASMLQWSEVVVRYGKPWIAVEGNHDQQADLNRRQVMDVLRSRPGSLSKLGPSDIHGYGNTYIRLTDSTNTTDAMYLYFFDSGDYSKYSTVSGYDWIWNDQIAWYLNTSLGLADRNKKVLPAVGFFHIPIMPYNDMLATTKIVGKHQEPVSCPDVASGLFTAMLETGDIKMTNVGHDHNNDFCGNWHGINLCYCGGSGFHAYGQKGWARRARVIDLTQNGTITSYKRLDPWTGKYQIIDQQTIYTP